MQHRLSEQTLRQHRHDTAEEHLAHRFTRISRVPKPLVYEVTRDAGYLHQFSLLLNGASVSGDAGNTLVVRSGNHCIGGCRLNFAAPGEILPMEAEGLRLRTMLAEYPLDLECIAELSHLTVLPEFKEGIVGLELFRHMLKHAAAKRARYMFALMPVAQARECRKALSQFGLKWDIRNDIIVADRESYEGVKMVLSVLDLTPLVRKKPAGSRAEEAALAVN